jgi:hypothetical protein
MGYIVEYTSQNLWDVIFHFLLIEQNTWDNKLIKMKGLFWLTVFEFQPMAD